MFLEVTFLQCDLLSREITAAADLSSDLLPSLTLSACEIIQIILRLLSRSEELQGALPVPRGLCAVKLIDLHLPSVPDPVLFPCRPEDLPGLPFTRWPLLLCVARAMAAKARGRWGLRGAAGLTLMAMGCLCYLMMQLNVLGFPRRTFIMKQQFLIALGMQICFTSRWFSGVQSVTLRSLLPTC